MKFEKGVESRKGERNEGESVMPEIETEDPEFTEEKEPGKGR